MVLNFKKKTSRYCAALSMDYGAWCQDISVEHAIKCYGRKLGNRFIRRYFKAKTIEVPQLP